MDRQKKKKAKYESIAAKNNILLIRKRVDVLNSTLKIPKVQKEKLAVQITTDKKWRHIWLVILGNLSRMWPSADCWDKHRLPNT